MIVSQTVRQLMKHEKIGKLVRCHGISADLERHRSYRIVDHCCPFWSTAKVFVGSLQFTAPLNVASVPWFSARYCPLPIPVIWPAGSVWTWSSGDPIETVSVKFVTAGRLAETFCAPTAWAHLSERAPGARSLSRDASITPKKFVYPGSPPRPGGREPLDSPAWVDRL